MSESERRKAGMAAFRAKMLIAHEKALAGGNPDCLKKGKLGDAARAYHAKFISDIKEAQLKFGEVCA